MVLEMVKLRREGTDDFEVTFFSGSSWGFGMGHWGYADLSTETETTPFQR